MNHMQKSYYLGVFPKKKKKNLIISYDNYGARKDSYPICIKVATNFEMSLIVSQLRTPNISSIIFEKY